VAFIEEDGTRPSQRSLARLARDHHDGPNDAMIRAKIRDELPSLLRLYRADKFC